MSVLLANFEVSPNCPHLDNLESVKSREYTKLLNNNSKMAPQKRFELLTFPLGGGRSIQLSYWGSVGNSRILWLTTPLNTFN